MKDGYVKTISSQSAYLGWTQIQNTESAKSLGYSQEIVNSLVTNVKYGDWYCSKKCAYRNGVEAFDE